MYLYSDCLYKINVLTQHEFTLCNFLYPISANTRAVLSGTQNTQHIACTSASLRAYLRTLHVTVSLFSAVRRLKGLLI